VQAGHLQAAADRLPKEAHYSTQAMPHLLLDGTS
jgi:hypothetical protein